MHTVAILGAGELGGALARTLAAGDAVSRIVLVDEAGNVAAGKALDIRQAGPIESYDTAVDGSDDIHQASGVDVIVMADRHGQAALERGGRAGAGGPSGQTGAGRAPGVCRRGRPRADDAGHQGAEAVDDAPDRVGAGGRRCGRACAECARRWMLRRWTSRSRSWVCRPPGCWRGMARVSAGAPVEMPAARGGACRADARGKLAPGRTAWPRRPRRSSGRCSRARADASAAFRRRRLAASTRWCSRRRSRSCLRGSRRSSFPN